MRVKIFIGNKETLIFPIDEAGNIIDAEEYFNKEPYLTLHSTAYVITVDLPVKLFVSARGIVPCSISEE